jgi:hypothetical protein
MTDYADLGAELRNLRKGRGVDDPNIDARVGPALAALCGIAPTDTPADTRRKLTRAIDRLAAQLPQDLRMGVRAALAVHPEARLPFYEERIRWLARQWQRDERTVRRRIDTGFVHLVEVAGRRDVEPSSKGWWVEGIQSLLLLDGPEPEVIEVRRVVASRDRLSTLEVVVGQPAGAAPPIVSALYGVELLRNIGTSGAGSLTVRLPVSLNTNEAHEFGLRYRLAPTKEGNPCFVCRPEVECERFDLRIRFDRNHLPQRVERVDGGGEGAGWDASWQRLADTPAAEVLSLDGVGEVHVYFRRLTPGLAYGMRWLPAEGREPGWGPAFETH